MPMPGLSAPFTKDDVNAMTDSVHCAFVDTKKAESGPLERTLSNCTCDLSETGAQRSLVFR